MQVASADIEAGGEKPRVQDYIEYRVWATAILDAHLPSEVEHLFAGVYRRHASQPPRRSVVIIDEIDKAPRDFPNDLLDEIDRLRFRVPELLRYAQSLSPSKSQDTRAQ